MGKGKNAVLKKCELFFAVCVILACGYTIFSTLSNRGHRPIASSESVLKFARDNFMMAVRLNNVEMKKTTMHLINSDIESSVELNDMTEKWFRQRQNDAYKPIKSHPLLGNEIITNKDICGNSTVDILIYVQSLWNNLKRRNDLRETWANKNIFKDINVKTVFILGKSESQRDQIKINNENLVHKDIIQGDFLDSFKNLTKKSILAMKWINNHCSQAKYIIKADDDVFVNIFATVEYLIPQIYEKDRSIMCHLKDDNTSPIMRNPNDKWYVPKEVFPNRTHFPRFCSGYAVLYTGDLVPLLYKASFDAPYFSVDDAYLFGLLLGQLKDVNFVSIQDHMTLNQKSALEEYEGNGPLQNVAAAAWQNGSMVKFWQHTLLKLTKWAQMHAKITIEKVLHK